MFGLFCIKSIIEIKNALRMQMRAFGLSVYERHNESSLIPPLITAFKNLEL